MSSFVQVVISQNELKLLGSVEKWITLNLLLLKSMNSSLWQYEKFNFLSNSRWRFGTF